MNYVYLESKYNEFYLNDEAYAQIVAIVQANKYCMFDSRNRHPYTKDNPCVGKNICVEHLLQKQRNLTRLDVVGTNADRSMYYFVDTHGYIYTSIEDSSDEARKDVLETLSFYGFTPPKTVESRGKTVDFYSHYATLHGDLRSASVIVLSYQHSQEKVKALFLLYKGVHSVELHKRGDHKTLYSKAEELVEATKDATNEYHIGGMSHYGRYESDIYEVISQLESAMYDVSRKIHNGTAQQPKEEQQEASV
jgi:hypothetical protein